MKTIVTTNGCFDILHRGHIELLEYASKLGDILIVCINSDESVRKLKGNRRPINIIEDRSYILLALECVDMVFRFDEATPDEILDSIRPDIHVKGGDYEEKDLPEADVVRKHGGIIKIFPTVKGYSTTDIIERGK